MPSRQPGARAGEGLAIKELILDEAMNGFDVTLPGVSLGRDITMGRTRRADGGVQTLLNFVFEELATVVGLPGEAGEVRAVTGQVDGELLSPEGGVRLGKLVGIAGETSAGDRFAGGRLEAGQIEMSQLRPVMGDVLQISGVGGKLAEERPATFGMPLSTTHAIPASIMGVGSAKRFSALKLGGVERILN